MKLPEGPPTVDGYYWVFDDETAEIIYVKWIEYASGGVWGGVGAGYKMPEICRCEDNWDHDREQWCWRDVCENYTDMEGPIPGPVGRMVT